MKRWSDDEPDGECSIIRTLAELKKSADTLRTWVLAAAAVGIGLAIAYVDSGPTWDDTGITAGALLIGGLVTSFAAGHRPWLWGILVGIWVSVFAILIDGNPAALLGLAFAIAGSYAGAAARSWLGHRGTAPGG